MQEVMPTMDRLSVKGVLLAFGCAAFPTLAGIGLPTAAAQAIVSSADTSGSTLVSGRAPQPAFDPGDLLEIEEEGRPGDMLPRMPAFGSETPPAPIATGPLDVIRESIFGAASAEEWQPLSLSTFFTEGWDQPFVKSPTGTNGAPKQNWFGSSDGIFSRLVSWNFFYTNGLTKNDGLLLSPFPWAPVKPNTTGNQYWASCNLYLPLNQRLELLVVAPFIASNTTSPTGHYVANFGDLTISERFRLIEQRNFSLQALLTERTPTGQTVTGNDINYITPSVEFWWNFAPKWVCRGGTGINIDTGRMSATDSYLNNFAIGRYLTSRDAPVFKQAVVHVAVATTSDVLGRKGHITDVYVGPGIRFGLDNDHKWFVLAAIEIPVAGPQPYAFQPNIAISRNY
jgi:hypothetical protein